ncbi:hypothetical protein D3C76_1381170 [compost metagenome]
MVELQSLAGVDRAQSDVLFSLRPLGVAGNANKGVTSAAQRRHEVSEPAFGMQEGNRVLFKIDFA